MGTEKWETIEEWKPTHSLEETFAGVLREVREALANIDFGGVCLATINSI